MSVAEFRAHIAGIMNGREERADAHLLYENNRNRPPEWALRGPDRGLTPSERLMCKAQIFRLFNQCAQALEEAVAAAEEPQAEFKFQ